MKIIYLSPVGTFKGGAERSLFDLTANPGVEPVVIAPEEGPVLDRARALGYKTHVLPFGSINTIHRPFSFMKGLSAVRDLIRAARGLKRIAKEENVRIVHSNGLKAHMINIVAGRLLGAKSVVHIRDIPYTSAEKLVWRIVHMLCHRMILVSHATWPGERLPRKAVVIHNGTPLIDGERPVRSGDTLTIGFIGRIHPAKGLHLLIDWIAQSGANVRLSVRGTYSTDAPNYEDEINDLIAFHRMESCVTFTGFIEDAAALYEGIDVVCVPSETPDPLPRSVMESMARGIPVFGYPAGGIFEMIEDGVTGFLIKDSAEFCDAVNYVSSHPQRLESMICAAKDKIAREFTIDGLHCGVSALYCDILGVRS